MRGFECLGACDLAPMASIDERYYGPLDEGDAAEAIEAAALARRDVLPEKRLEDREARRRQADPADRSRVTRHPMNKVKQKRRQESGEAGLQDGLQRSQEEG